MQTAKGVEGELQDKLLRRVCVTPQASHDSLERHGSRSLMLIKMLVDVRCAPVAHVCCGMAQVGEEEVALGLGPEWPTPRMLAGLQQQCLAMSFEVCQRSMAGNARAARLCRTLLVILAMTLRLQAAQGFHPDPALAERIRDGQNRMSGALHPGSDAA